MSRSSFVLLVAAAACSTPSGGEPARQGGDRAVVASAAVATDRVVADAAVEPEPRQDEGRGSPAESTIFDDPTFLRRFAESYLAETDVEPRVTVVERDRLQKVLETIGQDKLAEAAAQLEELRGPAASAVFDYTLANVYTRLDRIDDAAASYATAIDKYPKFRRAWKNFGLLHYRRGEFAAAATELARVVELGGGDGITYGFLGSCHLELGWYVSADSAYRMATMLDPTTIDWQMGLAQGLFKLQRYGDAAALCSALVGRYPERAGLWMLQASSYLGLGQALKAAECYEMVDQLGKATVESQLRLGDIYANEEIYDRAVAAYVRALELDPQASAERPLRAARLMVARGARTETKLLLSRLEALRGERLADGERKDLLHLRARMAVAEGAGDEHVALLEQIVTLDPLDGEALLLLGQHYGDKGDTARAVAFFERAAGIEAFEADAKVRHAQMLVNKLGRYSEALPLLRRAQAIKPRDNVQSYLEDVERFAQGRG